MSRKFGLRAVAAGPEFPVVQELSNTAAARAVMSRVGRIMGGFLLAAFRCS
jgi:hypothetical protein